MDPDRARELLAAERTRIERSLIHLEQQPTSEPADELDPANLASELYQDEFDEGLADDLREQLSAVGVPRRDLPPGRTVSRPRAARQSRTSASKRSPPLSGQSKRKPIDTARSAPPQRDASRGGPGGGRCARCVRTALMCRLAQ